MRYISIIGGVREHIEENGLGLYAAALIIHQMCYFTHLNTQSFLPQETHKYLWDGEEFQPALTICSQQYNFKHNTVRNIKILPKNF